MNDSELQGELKNSLLNCFLAEKSAKNMLDDKLKFNLFVDSSYKSPFFLGALNEIDTVIKNTDLKKQIVIQGLSKESRKICRRRSENADFADPKLPP